MNMDLNTNVTRATNKIECEIKLDMILGESPIWSHHHQCLIWVDTYQCKIYFYHLVTHHLSFIVLQQYVSFICLSRAEKLIIGMGLSLYEMTIEGKLQFVATLYLESCDNNLYRFNDAKLDINGRLWLGVIHQNLQADSGFLYCFELEHYNWRLIDNGFTLINGLDWSQENQYLYITDSKKGLIYRYHYDAISGVVSHKEIYYQQSLLCGKPDGLVVDPQNNILSVMFDGFSVIKLTETATLSQKINLPVPRPTSCIYVEQTKKLYITTAMIGLNVEQLNKYPLSGSLLSIDYPLK